MQKKPNSSLETYPYRNKIYNDEERKKIFQKLQNMQLVRYNNEKPIYYHNIKLNNVDFMMNGKYNYLMYNPKDYKYYMLSDLFNDECRSQCKFGSHQSPYEYFIKNKDKIKYSLIKKRKDQTPINIREEIYHNVKECSIHNPLIIKYFIEKYNAKKILDMSSGWGDRLLGSLLANVDLYLGVDPNKCLHSNYNNIINLLKPLTKNSKGEYILIDSGFEDIDLSNYSFFDLVYTSPPYFDYEKYSNDAKQSIFSVYNEDEWLDKFLYPSMIKLIKYLKYGGYLVFYFSQERGKTYIEKWMHRMKTYPNVYYLGNIFFSDIFLKNIHPIFIFQKNENIPMCLYNPSISISKIKIQNCKISDKNQNENHIPDKELFIIRDDYIIGGTKARAIIEYLKNLFDGKKNINELIYLGASNGYAPVALSYGLQLLKSNIKLTVYSQSSNLSEAIKIQSLAKYLYPKTNFIDLKKSFKEIWPLVDEHLSKQKNALLIPFGLHDKQYENYLFSALSNHLLNFINKIKRLWLVIGSGVLFSILYKILINTHFCLVQVGKNVDLHDYEMSKITIYKSSYRLYETININIPYATTKSYDGKIWEFCNEFQTGDYIWNVAGIHDKI
jgi:tRNA1(Val) A37 N6-methylase TrmN6